MLVKLSSPMASALDTDSGTKYFQASKIRLDSIPTFKRSAFESTMDASVMEVDGMD